LLRLRLTWRSGDQNHRHVACNTSSAWAWNGGMIARAAVRASKRFYRIAAGASHAGTGKYDARKPGTNQTQRPAPESGSSAERQITGIVKRQRDDHLFRGIGDEQAAMPPAIARRMLSTSHWK